MTEEHAGRHYQPKLLAVPGPGDLVKVASRTTLQTRRTQRIGCGKGKLNPRAGHVCKENLQRTWAPCSFRYFFCVAALADLRGPRHRRTSTHQIGPAPCRVTAQADHIGVQSPPHSHSGPRYILPYLVIPCTAVTQHAAACHICTIIALPGCTCLSAPPRLATNALR